MFMFLVILALLLAPLFVIGLVGYILGGRPGAFYALGYSFIAAMVAVIGCNVVGDIKSGVYWPIAATAIILGGLYVRRAINESQEHRYRQACSGYPPYTHPTTATAGPTQAPPVARPSAPDYSATCVVACIHCGQKNKVHVHRISEAICGRCKGNLTS